MATVATIGVSTTDSRATSLTGSATANNKGSYVELIASTSNRISRFVVHLHHLVSAPQFLVDIATGGAGSETIIVADLPHAVGNSNRTAYSVLLPKSIAAGTRISARCQATTASGVILIAIQGIEEATDTNLGYEAPVTYGAVAASTDGTDVTPGTSNADGSWVVITSSTSAVTDALLFTLANNADVSRVNTGYLFDVAKGATGSEVIIINDLFMRGSSGGDAVFPQTQQFLEIDSLASGTQLQVRARGDAATAEIVSVILLAFKKLAAAGGPSSGLRTRALTSCGI